MTTPARPPADPWRPPSTGNWFTRGGWWFLVHVLSLGILAPVPFAHAATVSRRRGHTALATLSVVLVATIFTLGTHAEKAPDGDYTGPADALGTVLLLFTWIAGAAALVVVRQQIYGRRRPPPPRDADPVVSAALEARHRRAEVQLRRHLRLQRRCAPLTSGQTSFVRSLPPAPDGLRKEKRQ